MDNQSENSTFTEPTGPTLPAGPIDINRIVNRSIAVLTDPVGVWPTIRAEAVDIKQLYVEYFAVLAAIPAVCGFVGSILFGLPFGYALTMMIIGYVMSLASIFITAFIIHKLAPTFDGSASLDNAVKLVGFSMVPGYVAGFLYIIPPLGVLGLLAGLYGLYILYVGIPEMTSVPREKHLTFFISIIVVAVLLGIVIQMLHSI